MPEHLGQSLVLLPGAMAVTVSGGWWLLTIVKTNRFPIHPGSNIVMVSLVPTLRCLPATNRVRLTEACLGATRLHLRFLPLPLQTRCLGTDTVCLEIGHVPFLALQLRIAFAPPGNLSIDIALIWENVAV